MIDTWTSVYSIDDVSYAAVVVDRLLLLWDLPDDASRFSAACELSDTSFAHIFLQSWQYRESLRMMMAMGFDLDFSPSVYGCMILHALPSGSAVIMAHASSESDRLGYACVAALSLLLLEHDWGRLTALCSPMADLLHDVVAAEGVFLSSPSLPEVSSGLSSARHTQQPAYADSCLSSSVQNEAAFSVASHVSVCVADLVALVSLAVSLVTTSDFCHYAQY